MWKVLMLKFRTACVLVLGSCGIKFGRRVINLEQEIIDEFLKLTTCTICLLWWISATQLLHLVSLSEIRDILTTFLTGIPVLPVRDSCWLANDILLSIVSTRSSSIHWQIKLFFGRSTKILAFFFYFILFEQASSFFFSREKTEKSLHTCTN